MAEKCKTCGRDTELFVGGIPTCAICDQANDALNPTTELPGGSFADPSHQSVVDPDDRPQF